MSWSVAVLSLWEIIKPASVCRVIGDPAGQSRMKPLGSDFALASKAITSLQCRLVALIELDLDSCPAQVMTNLIDLVNQREEVPTVVRPVVVRRLGATVDVIEVLVEPAVQDSEHMPELWVVVKAVESRSSSMLVKPLLQIGDDQVRRVGATVHHLDPPSPARV